MYHNYHKHDHYGNPWAMDVIVKPEDYCKRAIELGHNTVFTTNHGVTGNIFDWIDLIHKKDADGNLLYNLKLIYGTEAYYVKDRFEKDRSNKHIVIVAKNNDGVLQLNDIMTEAHDTGFYYKPRIDNELLFSLNPDNFIVTSACVAGLWDEPELLIALHEKFGKNFFLEVQSHNMSKQIEANQTILNLSKIEHIPIIHANDSHYIYQKDSQCRDILLKAKNIYYADEEESINDYPDEDTIYERYARQGVLNKEQVAEALANTFIFEECSELTLINDDIKLPSVSDNPIEDLKKIVNSQWRKIRKDIPTEEHSKYFEAMKEEMKVIENTNMANYFLIDYNVAKIAKEKYGGVLTKTGRGSAPSFFTTKVLDLTNIDRIAAPITLFPSRFMSVERILGSRSLPDIDLNTSDREPFIKATENLLGKENCAWMLSWKPMQKASAFRVYCKGIGLDISEYDEVAKNLDKYENDKKWKDIIKESSRFVGVIEGVSESPCSMLLYNKPVRKELGLVRTPAGKLCCLLDGYNCDKFKYLKNDYLTVTIWAIIRDVCKLVGIHIPTINELNNLLDDKTYDIYKNGLTCTINQADSDYATPLAKRYCPHSVSEMSAFVAIIRPGCASLLDDFIERKSYTTGVPELDDILVEGNHRMIYQELIMKYLIWLGIPESGSYDIIKKIAKKKFKETELTELKKKLLEGWMGRVGKEEGFIETWTVVEQAAKYSFNACVSGDTKIQRAGSKGHWTPTVEEMYKIKNNIDYAKQTNHFYLHKKYNKYGYGNALSMFDDKRIHKNKIVDIYDSGIADIYRVTTENGGWLDCTLNHRFPTINGKKQLSELSVGDYLYLIDKYEKHPDNYRFTNGVFDSNIPKKGEKGFQQRPDGNSVKFNNLLKYCQEYRLPCSICGKQYDSSKFELHHKDHDRTNNEKENLEWCCNSCHKKIHYQDGRKKMYDKGIPTLLSKIVSIEYIRTDHVYDIEMESPAHTFISESGLVTSNSHSLSYAYDSLYGAYLKSHYPLEYYKVVFDYYSGDEDRTNKLTKELPYFGIKLSPIKFRHSIAKYSFDKTTNQIFKGIASIKFMNEAVADEMYELRNNHYSNFIELLDDLKSKTTLNSRQLDILIKLDFFEEFGETNHLLRLTELYDMFGGKVQIRKDKLSALNIPFDKVVPFAEKETDKMFTKVNASAFLSSISTEIQVSPRTLKEKVAAQIELLGYCDIADEKYDRMAAIISVDTKYSPKLKAYSLKNGTTLDVKIDKKAFNKCKLVKGDIVRINGTQRKQKSQKDENGNWIKIAGTSELWITSYKKTEI